MDTPQIYVACLAAYNRGTLFGVWIECDQDSDEIHAEIQQMLKDSPYKDAEEWAIHDYSDFGDFTIAEYESIERVVELAELIDQAASKGVPAAVLSELVTIYGEDEAASKLNEGHGCWDSLGEWAENYWEDSGNLDRVPDSLRYHIDFEAWGNEVDGDLIDAIYHDGDYYIFSR